MASVTDDVAKLFTKIQVDQANATSVALAKAGYQLGLYKAMGELDEFEPAHLAERTGTLENYIRDWLVNQAGAGYVSYNNETCKFYLNTAQKEVFTNESSPRYATPGMLLSCGIMQAALTETTDEMRTGAGVSFGSHERIYIDALAMNTHAVHKDTLAKTWIPACVGNELSTKLHLGGETLVIGDVGCGYGVATRLMAKAFAKSHIFIGLDNDDGSVEAARMKAANESLSNCLFVRCDAHHLPAPTEVPHFEELWRKETSLPVKTYYDLIVCINVLHDVQDPLAALVAARTKLEPINGCYIVIEPPYKEPLQDNFNASGQFFMSASITWCTPGGNIPREDGVPKMSKNLGFAPVSSYEQLAKQAGFSRFRKMPIEPTRVFVLQI